ncbi:hypothetical protein DEA8626_04056 [Defluviimonas aquaemixtae]|uniref:SOS response-associated peptidase YedK n=1 Tax=Albidovulum aquaemixtae TaxID=1542388 RepID=A0A2R8BNK5_9RHOB|nr:hypothetical protein DEA8626_04056 [Defluviimonas aquaemixtae]
MVPFTSFAENNQGIGKEEELVWFALDESRPLVFFAGIWTTWTSVRKLRDGETTDDIHACLNTEPNEVVAPVHQKAIPLILRSEAEIDA